MKVSQVSWSVMFIDIVSSPFSWMRNQNPYAIRLLFIPIITIITITYLSDKDQVQKIMTALIAILMVLTFITKGTKIQCEYALSNWNSGAQFGISKRQMIVSTIYDHIDLIVDVADSTVSQVIRSRGTWEPSNIRTMARFVKQGSSVLNVGSHVGLEAIVLGKIAGQAGKLFVFEPYSVSYNIALKNIYLNKLGKIASVYNIGASNSYSRGSIKVPLVNTGMGKINLNKIKQNYSNYAVNIEEITVDKVDNVLPQGTVIDFALIDVQRMQVECLEGMKETISRSPNIVIMCEWSGPLFNPADDTPEKTSIKKKLLEWLVQKGFKFYEAKQLLGSCSQSVFYQLELTRVLSINKIQDIFIVPGQKDPNSIK